MYTKKSLSNISIDFLDSEAFPMDPVFAPVRVPQPTPHGVTQALRPEKGSSNFYSIFPSIFHMIIHLETPRNL